MVRFNYISGLVVSGLIGVSSLLTSCHKQEKPLPQAPARIEVKVAGTPGEAAGGTIFSGTVEYADASIVSFSVPGTISKIYIEEGQKVSKGQLIARVESGSLSDARNIAQAALEEARDAYNRLKKLHDANALPDIKWVEIQSKLKQAENAAAMADRAVNDASIYAPISGYVAQKFANDGQTVVPAEPVAKIVALDRLQVVISVPENEIEAFGDAAEATVTFDLADNLTVKGKLNSKSVVADPLTRAYTVKFDINNAGGKILPGMIGSVTVSGLTNEAAVANISGTTLPSQAVLLASDNRQFVWVVKDGEAMRKFVVADELTPSGVTVRSGLAPGDSVIVAGMQKVSTGTPVAVVE